MQGSPLSRADLRAVNVNLCDMCVILSAKVLFYIVRMMVVRMIHPLSRFLPMMTQLWQIKRLFLHLSISRL